VTQLQHRGLFGIDAAIMIGFAMLGLVAVMVMHMGIIEMIVPTLHERINYMPTFHTYENGTRVTIEDPIAYKKNRSVFNKNIEDQINDIRLKILDLEKEKIRGNQN